MRRTNHERTKFIGSVLFLLVFAVGIGYAVLTERLTVDQTINYESMKWDVGFTTAVDGGGTVVSTPVISQDKKTISLSCSIGSTSESQTCIAIVTIKNSGTFDVKLGAEPAFTYDENFIESIDVSLSYSGNSIVPGHVIYSNFEEELEITVTTKNLDKDELPESSKTVLVDVTMNWVERAPGNIVTFDLFGKTYKAEDGMRVIDWIYSKYNTDNALKNFNFRACDSGYIYIDDSAILRNGVNQQPIMCDDVISDGAFLVHNPYAGQ